MKRNNWFLGLLICVFIFGIFIVSCDSSDGVVNPVTTTTTYSGTSGDTTYTLVITGLARAAAGDTYVLTVVKSGVSKRSSGTIATVTQTGFTLKPNSSGSQNFTLTFSGTTITSISGTIAYDNGTSEAGPGSFGTAGGDIPGPSNPGTNVLPVITEFFTTTLEGVETRTKIPTTSFSKNQIFYVFLSGSHGSNGLVKQVFTIKSGSTVVSDKVFECTPVPGGGLSGYHGTFYVYTPGSYTIEIYTEDTEGNRSNTVSTAFMVTEDVLLPVVREFFTTTLEGAETRTKIPTTSFSVGQGFYIFLGGSHGSNGLAKKVFTIKSGSTVVSDKVFTEAGTPPTGSGIPYSEGGFIGYHGTFYVDTPGSYTVEAYVEDTESNRSNTVSATFTVTGSQGGNQGGNNPGGSTDSALNGTWVSPISSGSTDGGIDGGGWELTGTAEYTFNNGDVSYIRKYPDNPYNISTMSGSKGTYTTSGNTLMFTLTHVIDETYGNSSNPVWVSTSVQSFQATYSISGNTLSIFTGGELMGVFTRQ